MSAGSPEMLSLTELAAFRAVNKLGVERFALAPGESWKRIMKLYLKPIRILPSGLARCGFLFIVVPFVDLPISIVNEIESFCGDHLISKYFDVVR